MKYTIILVLSLLVTTGAMKAQSNWEIGGRFGDDFSLDMTIPLSTSPRLHTAVYFYRDIAFGAYFDWMFKLSDGPQGLKFYPGVGPELYLGNNVNVAVAGDFGTEYSFDFPFTLGLDWRPRFMISDGMKFYSGNWGVTFRFRIGEGVRFVKTD